MHLSCVAASPRHTSLCFLHAAIGTEHGSSHRSRFNTICTASMKGSPKRSWHWRLRLVGAIVVVPAKVSAADLGPKRLLGPPGMCRVHFENRSRYCPSCLHNLWSWFPWCQKLSEGCSFRDSQVKPTCIWKWLSELEMEKLTTYGSDSLPFFIFSPLRSLIRHLCPTCPHHGKLIPHIPCTTNCGPLWGLRLLSKIFLSPT